jgi:hypothetical protein
MSRYTVRQAADMLGISTGAVRSRLARGTLRSVKESGTVYVLLSADTPRQPERHSTDELTDELRDRLRYVEAQLEAERQAHSEARRLLAAALERIPAIEAPSEPRESPESVDHEPESTESRTEQAEPQRSAERPWWRRVFGR